MDWPLWTGQGCLGIQEVICIVQTCGSYSRLYQGPVSHSVKQKIL